jgi:hypothetical protein
MLERRHDVKTKTENEMQHLNPLYHLLALFAAIHSTR